MFCRLRTRSSLSSARFVICEAADSVVEARQLLHAVIVGGNQVDQVGAGAQLAVTVFVMEIGGAVHSGCP